MSGKRPQVVVAQLGARMHYAVPVLLHRAGLLAHFFTDAYAGAGSAWRRWQSVAALVPPPAQPKVLQRLLGRRHDGLPAARLTACNWLGLRFGLALCRAGDLPARRRIWQRYADEFCRLVVRDGSFQGDAIYASPGLAVPLFEHGARQGMFNILEGFGLPEIIQDRLHREEQARWPGWEPPLPPPDGCSRRRAAEAREWALADVIFAPSPFAIQGLMDAGAPPEKIRLVPYGLELPRFMVARQARRDRRPLRVLFAGGVTLLKGPQYLLAALELLHSSQVTARMVGPVAIQEPYRSRLRRRVELVGPVPRADMPRHYAWADVLVFPTICDSFGQVQVEAMAAGLPVIATPHAGQVVRDRLDGFLVPGRDPAAIAARIAILARERDLWDWMSHQARERARHFSLESYGARLIGGICDRFEEQRSRPASGATLA